MTAKEIVRMVLKLREKGWSGDEITDFILYVEGRDEDQAEK